MLPNLDELADVVVLTVENAQSPLLARLAAMEARLDGIGDLRDRVVVVETKASMPTAVLEALTEPDAAFLSRLTAVEALVQKWDDLRDRVVTVETKAASMRSVEAPVVDLAPILARVAATEGHLTQLVELRDRVVTMETKAAQPPAVDFGDIRDRLLVLETNAARPSVDGAAFVDCRERLIALERKSQDDPITKEIAAIRERLAVAEVREPVPGPLGANGKDGADGLGFDDLVVEHDGERTFTLKYVRGDKTKEAGSFTIPSMIYRGMFTEGKTYKPGDVITYASAMWHCLKTTVVRPDGVIRDEVSGVGGIQGKDFWTLVVKQGRDGKPGLNGKDGANGRDLAPQKEPSWRS